MQNLTIAGTVGKDAILRTTGKGDKVLGFRVGVSNGKDADGNWRDSTWYDCSIWDKRAESLEGKIKKGDKLVLNGRPSAREHDGKAYLQLSVNDFSFMGGKRESQDQSGGGGYQQGAPAGGYDDGDEIPFAAEWRA